MTVPDQAADKTSEGIKALVHISPDHPALDSVNPSLRIALVPVLEAGQAPLADALNQISGPATRLVAAALTAALGLRFGVDQHEFTDEFIRNAVAALGLSDGKRLEDQIAAQAHQVALGQVVCDLRNGLLTLGKDAESFAFSYPDGTSRVILGWPGTDAWFALDLRVREGSLKLLCTERVRLTAGGLLTFERLPPDFILARTYHQLPGSEDFREDDAYIAFAPHTGLWLGEHKKPFAGFHGFFTDSQGQTIVLASCVNENPSSALLYVNAARTEYKMVSAIDGKRITSFPNARSGRAPDLYTFKDGAIYLPVDFDDGSFLVGINEGVRYGCPNIYGVIQENSVVKAPSGRIAFIVQDPASYSTSAIDIQPQAGTSPTKTGSVVKNLPACPARLFFFTEQGTERLVAEIISSDGISYYDTDARQPIKTFHGIIPVENGLTSRVFDRIACSLPSPPKKVHQRVLTSRTGNVPDPCSICIPVEGKLKRIKIGGYSTQGCAIGSGPQGKIYALLSAQTGQGRCILADLTTDKTTDLRRLGMIGVDKLFFSPDTGRVFVFGKDVHQKNAILDPYSEVLRSGLGDPRTTSLLFPPSGEPLLWTTVEGRGFMTLLGFDTGKFYTSAQMELSAPSIRTDGVWLIGVEHSANFTLRGVVVNTSKDIRYEYPRGLISLTPKLVFGPHGELLVRGSVESRRPRNTAFEGVIYDLVSKGEVPMHEDMILEPDSPILFPEFGTWACKAQSASSGNQGWVHGSGLGMRES